MKRILLFTDILGSGGAQRQLVILAALLKQTGYNVRLLDYWNDTFYDDYLVRHQIPFEHIHTKGKWRIIRMFTNKVRQFKPDVVISYMEHPSIVACIGKSLCLRKFKLIVSERNTSQSITKSIRFRFFLFRYLADYVVSNSNTQYSFINKHFPNLSAKTLVIINVVDSETFSPSTTYPKQNDGIIKFLVVARVVEQKNVLRFIEAVSLLKENNQKFRVDWYGNSYPIPYFVRCKELINNYGLQDCFFFHAPTQEITSIYRSADVFILPSIYEGFPNTLCEAMACGLPVIASAVCDNPYIVSSSEYGILVNPLKKESIALAMETLIGMSSKERKQMGSAGREHIITICSASKFVKSYIELIEKI